MISSKNSLSTLQMTKITLSFRYGYWYMLVLGVPLRRINCFSIWIVLLKRYRISGVVLSVI